MRSHTLAVVLLLGAAGCTGLVAGGDPPGSGNPGGTGSSPGNPGGSGGNTGSPGTGGGGSPGTGGGTTGQPTTPITGSATTQLCAQQQQASPGLRIGRTLLRRITRAEFNNTVRDLLGVTGTPAAALSLDERVGPFFNNAIAPITDLVVQQHEEVAARVAADAAARMNAIAPCDLAADSG